MIPQSHAVPEEGAISRLSCLPVAIFANDILYGIELRPAVIGINDDLGPSDFVLFLPVHQRLLLHLLLILLLGFLILSARANDFVLVRSGFLLFLLGVALLLLESHAIVVKYHLLLRRSVVRRLYLRLRSSLVLDFLLRTHRAWR